MRAGSVNEAAHFNHQRNDPAGGRHPLDDRRSTEVDRVVAADARLRQKTERPKRGATPIGVALARSLAETV
jgi:hypothetical protein